MTDEQAVELRNRIKRYEAQLLNDYYGPAAQPEDEPLSNGR